jgi:serine/threonine protein kinase
MREHARAQEVAAEAGPLHPSPAELAEFDRGRLGPARWQALEEHLVRCTACAERLSALPTQDLDQLIRELDGAGETVPTGPPIGHTPPFFPTDQPPVPPELLDHPRYRVLGMIGAGGMGRVFKAEHLLMGRVVALKVPRPALVEDAAAVERFRREVRAAARLAHPNIVTAYDADQVGPLHLLVMEYVEGVTLDRLAAKSGPLPVADVRRWVRQVAEGLRYAHGCGMVHRDLKPANLILAADGAVKILDFGLARFASEQAGRAGTPSGAVVGTPEYIAPEQARDPRSADARADIYSLGCTWYYLLTGRPPFSGGTVLQQLLAHQEQAPPPLADFRPDVPRETQAVLLRLLAKDPADRFQSADELLRALGPSETQAPSASSRAFPWKWIAAAAGIAGAVMLSLFLVNRGDRHPLERADPTRKELSNTKAADKGASLLSARDQVADWLRRNNAFGPEHLIVEDNARRLDEKLAGGKAFILRLGPKLVKSGRPTILAGRQRDFFAFELSPKSSGIDDFSTALIVTAAQSQEFFEDLPVLLSNLTVNQKGALDGDRDVIGSVTYRGQANVGGKLALRLTFMLGTSTRTHYWLLDQDEVTGQGELPFCFNGLYSGSPRTTGPHVLFVDLVALNVHGRKAEALVLSNTFAELVTVRDTKGEPEAGK